MHSCEEGACVTHGAVSTILTLSAGAPGGGKGGGIGGDGGVGRACPSSCISIVLYAAGGRPDVAIRASHRVCTWAAAVAGGIGGAAPSLLVFAAAGNAVSIMLPAETLMAATSMADL